MHYYYHYAVIIIMIKLLLYVMQSCKTSKLEVQKRVSNFQIPFTVKLHQMSVKTTVLLLAAILLAAYGAPESKEAESI